MNTGKICISICAKTADELFEKIRRAEPLADIIEIRFDCFQPEEIKSAVARAAESRSDKLLATFRPLDQGGKRELSKDERDEFWFTGNDTVFWGGDFEEDIIEEAVYWLWFDRICSFHDFSGNPIDVGKIFERLNATNAKIIKIAIQANDAVDSIQVWKLLEHGKSDDKPVIPIAMGEAGKWTRILGLAHGVFMTYASLDAGEKTAPGQISAGDMIDVFRVKQLNKDTEVYGLIAGDTSYSVSPWMHNIAFKEKEMNRVFVPFQTSDLDEFMRRMVMPETREVDLNLRGFSVTNPHKKEIIRYLDRLDETAKKIGAVNTVKIENGKLLGYNTDAHGFIAPLKKVFNSLKGKRVAIAGTGGAARACTHALKQEGADVTIYARKPRNAVALAEEFDVRYGNATNSFRPGTVDILVNATPLGTKGGNENAAIVSGNQLNGIKLIYDLVYNPLETQLLFEARQAGIQAIGGLEMLVAQGAKQFEIWIGEPAPIQKMTAAVKNKLK